MECTYSLKVFSRSGKLSKFWDIYDVQILTMMCINNRSVNVGRREKGPPKKMFKCKGSV